MVQIQLIVKRIANVFLGVFNFLLLHLGLSLNLHTLGFVEWFVCLGMLFYFNLDWFLSDGYNVMYIFSSLLFTKVHWCYVII